MQTTSLETLKINVLTQAQYDALGDGAKDDEIYLTPDNNELDTTSFLRVEDPGTPASTNPINATLLDGKPASNYSLKTEVTTQIQGLTSQITGIQSDVTEQIDTLSGQVEGKAPLESPTFTGTAKITRGDSTFELYGITFSTQEPISSDKGDIWIVYE